MSDAPEGLVNRLRDAVAADPGVWKLRRDLTHALTSAGQFDEALALLSRLAAERPDDHAVQRELVEVYETIRLAEIKMPVDTASAPASADRAFAHLADARTCHTRGDLQGAEANYIAALQLQPNLINALQNLGLLLLESRRSVEAMEVAHRILKIAPDNASAYFILGSATASLGSSEAAIDFYRQAIAADPDMAAAHIQLGIIMRKTGRWDVAVQCFERAVVLRPHDPVPHTELGVVLERQSQKARASIHFARAQELQPLRIVPACKATADFTVLLLWSPGRANTPMQYLLEQAHFECRFLALVPGVACDVNRLQGGEDVVLNLISDVDQTRDFLPTVAEFVERLGRPVFNHPRAILATDRESTASLLGEIPDIRVPRSTRCARDDLSPSKIGGALFGHTFPLLLRVAGTHGGDDFERLNGVGEIAMFLAQHPADEYYLAEYVDYQSADGYFRKYRVIFVNGEVIPYHLAIGDQWKVHHFRTTMKDHPWMQEEEEAFLTTPECVFSPQHFAALHKIQSVFGLDFFGVDCAIDRNGDLLIFEANASMLVQPDDSKFPHKIPRNVQVKAAFQTMLARAAADARAI
ncbi:MAG: tetratricopeptide repeat protein [Rhodospirillaceae bacterium]|nr:MAG: tetratricopeptide repeat protein [Rhodospirillaceae bacterium]